MTTLQKDQAHSCKAAMPNGNIITVCDKQCPNCEKLEKQKDNE